MAVDKQELAAGIYSRLVANYPHIHTKIGPGGKPTGELEHVLRMIYYAAQAASDYFFEQSSGGMKGSN